MTRLSINIVLFLLASCCAVGFSSCMFFRPLSLEPVKNSDSLQSIRPAELSKLNGDYLLMSADSASTKLDYTFTYKSIFDRENLPGQNDFINLTALDDTHLKATLFVNNRKLKSKTYKGRLVNNSFQFHSGHFSFTFFINVFRQQTNRVSLSKENDLYLDTNSGGIGFLLIMPIPLSGSSMDTYNLKFKRK